MKCELCHKNDAETALSVLRDGVEDELYVCKACANAERVKRQKKRQRTRRKDEGDDAPQVEMTVTQIGGDDGEEPPPIVQALMHAFDGLVSGIEAAAKNAKGNSGKEARGKPVKMHTLSLKQVPEEYLIRGLLHLEGLSLIGESEAVERALRALKMELVGMSINQIDRCGRAFAIKYSGSSVQAKRVLADILEQEKNARERLVGDVASVFLDIVCRSLATIKNCRLMSWGEFFDCLSPLRLAAQLDFLDGITAGQITLIMNNIKFIPEEAEMTVEECDRLRASCARSVNNVFRDVVLSEKAEGLLK